MKCLLISGIYRPEIGGPATYLPTLATVLIDQSNQIEIITLKNSTAPALSEAWPVNYIARDQNLLLRFIKTVMLIIRKAIQNDSIFSNGLIQETAVALMFIKRKSVAKVVGDPVWERARNKGLTRLSINEFNDSKLNINQRFQRWLICWSLNRFDRITCPSIELKSLMQEWGVVKPIEFIPNGVDLNFGHSGRSNDYIARTVLSFVDRMKPDLVLVMYSYPSRREYYTKEGGIEPFALNPWGYYKEHPDGIKEFQMLEGLSNVEDDYMNWYKNHQLITYYLQSKGIPFIWNGVFVNTEYVDDNRFDGDYKKYSDSHEHASSEENKKYAENLYNHIKRLGIIKNL